MLLLQFKMLDPTQYKQSRIIPVMADGGATLAQYNQQLFTDYDTTTPSAMRSTYTSPSVTVHKVLGGVFFKEIIPLWTALGTYVSVIQLVAQYTLTQFTDDSSDLYYLLANWNGDFYVKLVQNAQGYVTIVKDSVQITHIVILSIMGGSLAILFFVMFGVVRRTVNEVEDNKDAVLDMFTKVPKTAIKRFVARLTARLLLIEQMQKDTDQGAGDDQELMGFDTQEEKTAEDKHVALVGVNDDVSETTSLVSNTSSRNDGKISSKSSSVRQHGRTANTSQRLIVLARVMSFVVVAAVYLAGSYYLEIGLEQTLLSTAPSQTFVSLARVTQMRRILVHTHAHTHTHARTHNNTHVHLCMHLQADEEQ